LHVDTGAEVLRNLPGEKNDLADANGFAHAWAGIEMCCRHDAPFHGNQSLSPVALPAKWQMRWTPIGAHRFLQVRAAIADGRLKQAKLDLAA
jgi:hypothetical protein